MTRRYRRDQQLFLTLRSGRRPSDAEECVDQGWAVKRGGGSYEYALTDKGRVLLQELGEVGSMSSSK